MARDSIEYSFLPGASLWSTPEQSAPVAACGVVTPQDGGASGACGRFLAGSEKARVQRRLEADFTRFEKSF